MKNLRLRFEMQDNIKKIVATFKTSIREINTIIIIAILIKQIEELANL